MGLLITGMHRSGTSAIARWVDALGVTGGSVGDFPVNTANPTGLYELTDVVALNDRWLGLLGGSWWAPPTVKEQTWRSLDAAQLDSDRETLPAFTRESRNWLIKDPRISVLLPLWDRLLLRRDPVLIGLRAPRDVAMSLHVRSGTTFRRGLALWAFYNHELLAHQHDRPALVVDFDTALRDPAPMVKGLAGFLGDLGTVVGDERYESTLATVEPKLRRNRVDRLDGTAEFLARDLDDAYEGLRDRHLQAPTGESFALPDWAREALDELGEFWSLQVERDIARGERDFARGERDIAVGERDIARGERDIAVGERDTAVGERDLVRGERDIARGERDAAAAQRDRLAHRYRHIQALAARRPGWLRHR